MLFFANNQVRLMAEVIGGEVIGTSFEDDEYGPDPMHQSDNGFGNVEDSDSSDDDKSEKLYVDPAESAGGRVQDVERVEVVIDPTLSAVSYSICSGY